MARTPVLKISANGKEEVYPIVEQSQVDRLAPGTIAEAEAQVFLADEVCFISEASSWYEYDPGSSATRDGVFVLNTGGTGRLIRMPSLPISAYLSKTSNYTITNSDPRTIDGNTDSGPITFTMPASPLDGTNKEIKNTGASGNVLTVARNGNAIDGQAENIPLEDGESVPLQYTTDGWQIR
jgi:hypothetical protein